jgi:hypothetical protein
LTAKKITQRPKRLGTEKELVELSICFTADYNRYVSWGSGDVRKLSGRKKLPLPRIEPKFPGRPTRGVVTVPIVPTRNECHIEIL